MLGLSCPHPEIEYESDTRFKALSVYLALGSAVLMALVRRRRGRLIQSPTVDDNLLRWRWLVLDASDAPWNPQTVTFSSNKTPRRLARDSTKSGPSETQQTQVRHLHTCPSGVSLKFCRLCKDNAVVGVSPLGPRSKHRTRPSRRSKTRPSRRGCDTSPRLIAQHEQCHPAQGHRRPGFMHWTI